ncbi:MAG: hypothetical protein R6X32_10715 [Chloroflexota bacterium]
MKKNSQTNLTDKNLDQLNEFLNKELAGEGFAAQIPDGAHLFYGSAINADLTRDNLDLAAKVWLGMMLGYIEDAPLTMVYEKQPGQQVTLDLSTMLSKKEAESAILRFQKESRQQISSQIQKALAV